MVDADNPNAKSVLNLQFSMKSDAYITSPPISEDVLKQKYLENGLSTRSIASEFSCSKTHIRDLLVRYKIPLRGPLQCHNDHGRAYGKKRRNGQSVDHKAELRTIETMKTMYSKEGLHPRAIARLLNTLKVPTKQQGKGWHHHTVITILKREGVYIGKTQIKTKS